MHLITPHSHIGALEFVQSLPIWKINQVDFILGDILKSIYMINLRRKLMHLMMCRDGKEVNLKLIMTPMVGDGKSNLVLIDQMKNDQITIVVWMEQLQINNGESWKYAFLWKLMCKGLARCKYVITNKLLREILPNKEVNKKIKAISIFEPPSKATYRLNQKICESWKYNSIICYPKATLSQINYYMELQCSL